jgi:spore maturation protein CgeB
MRVLIVAPLFQEWYAGRFILRAAKVLGLEVLGFDYRFPFNLRDIYLGSTGVDIVWHSIVNKVQIFQRSFVRKVNEQLIRVAESYCPDLVLVCEGELLECITLKRIKEAVGSKLAFWTFDDPQLIERHLNVACVFDACFTNSVVAMQTYEDVGVKAYYLPWGCDPSIHTRLPYNKLQPKYVSDVCFHGAFHPKRYIYLHYLHTLMPDVRLGVWGVGWNQLSQKDSLKRSWRGSITRLLELVKMYSGTKIALNIQRTETTLTTTTSRIWEATACGAMLLTERVAGIDLAFKPGQEVVCYENKRDLIEKVTFYLNNEDMRRKIALRGQIRCKKDHTVSNRLKKIIEMCR